MNGRYPFELRYDDELVKLGVHTDNLRHEPQIRWHIESSGATGEHGSLSFHASDEGRRVEFHFNPISATERPTGEPDPRVAGEHRSKLVTTRETVAELIQEFERLAVATNNEASVCTDPGVYPSEVDDLTKDYWDAERSLMWYVELAQDDSAPSRFAYQLEGGTLVQRSFELEHTSYRELAVSLRIAEVAEYVETLCGPSAADSFQAHCQKFVDENL